LAPRFHLICLFALLYGGLAIGAVADRTEWTSLAVRVVDADGKGIPRVSFILVPPTGVRRGLLPTGGMTDGEGRVRLDVKAGLKYQVRFSPHSTGYYGSYDIHVPKGEPELRVDVAPKKCLEVTGTVLGPDGKPIEKMRVTCIARLPDGDNRWWSATTDGAGGFTVRAVVPLGTLSITASKTDGDQMFSTGRIPLDIKSEDPLVLRASVKKVVQQPRVSVELVFVRVVNGVETAMTDIAQVTAIGPAEPRYEHERDHSRRLVENRNGKLHLKDALLGKYTLRKSNLLSARRLYIRDRSFELTAHSRVVKFVVEQMPEATVVVQDAVSGEPIPGAMVSVVGLGKRLTTDDGGKVTFRAMPPHANVRVSHGKLYTPRTVVAPTGKTTTVSLRKEVLVRGTVMDWDGKPVSGAHILAMASREDQTGGSTSKDGTFQFRPLRSKRFKMVVFNRHHQDFAPEVFIVDWTKGKDIRVQVSRGVAVRISVKIGDGEVSSTKLGEGIVALLDARTHAVAAPVYENRKLSPMPIRLKPGAYKAVWLGKEAGFFVGSIQIDADREIALDIVPPKKEALVPRRQLVDLMLGVPDTPR
jgi:hypothetical protein